MEASLPKFSMPYWPKTATLEGLERKIAVSPSRVSSAGTCEPITDPISVTPIGIKAAGSPSISRHAAVVSSGLDEARHQERSPASHRAVAQGIPDPQQLAIDRVIGEPEAGQPPNASQHQGH